MEVIKISDGKEMEVTKKVAEEISEIIKSFYMSVSDNYIVCNKSRFSEAYEKARELFLFGKI